MPQLSPAEIDRLTQAVRTHDLLRRIVAAIDELQRVVFHANARVDWSLSRRSAEQILIAEMVYRYQGDPARVPAALQTLEHGRRTRDAAIAEFAAAAHSYYTTPLGMVMRQDLFGPDNVFITPDAHAWTAQLQGRETPADRQEP